MEEASAGPEGSVWAGKLARRTARMRRSAVRDLLRVAARPEIISFAGGLPAPELFPVEAVRRAAAAVLRRNPEAALQYGETEGLAALRDRLVEELPGGRGRWSREQVVITSGAQQALDLLGRVLVDPGDEVAVENPTYLALLSAWAPLGVEFRGIPGDDEGLRVEALERGARPPKLLYLVPNFQNPRGTSLSGARRRALVRWARARGVGLIEDDPYGELRYEGGAEPSLLELDAEVAGADPGGEGGVIRCGTFSKVLAPGLRLGWVVAPVAVAERLVLAKQAADLHTSTFSQSLVLELLERGVVEAQRPRLREEYRRRRDALLEALARHFPADVRWTRPEGGMFLLLTLPDGVDAGALLPAALEQGVAFVPGESFHLGGEGRNTLRLNFTHPDPERIREGVRRLARVVARG